jgi:hypothetical protein
MTPDRFAAILAAYGADPTRWPDAERVAAETIARTADPRAIAGAAAFDTLLDDFTVVWPGADLVQRIVASAPRRRPWRILLPGFGLAAATAAFGIVAGVIVQPVAAPPIHGGETEALSYGWGGESGEEEGS